MKHTIPSQKVIRQLNRDEYSGELYATKGIDLTSARGRIRPTKPVINIADDTDDAQLTFPSAFLRTSADATDKWWAICGAVLFKTSDTTFPQTWTQDAIASSPTNLSHLFSDMVEFNSSLIVSNSDDLHKLTAGTWTASWWDGAGNLNQSAMTASITHPLFVGFTNQLLIGDGRYIHTVDVNNKVRTNRVTLRPEYRIRWIQGNSTSYFIGADHKYGGEGKVFEWDGASENFNREYGIQSDVSFSCAVKNEIPYIVNRVGQLLKFTGGGFSSVAQFPVAYTKVAPHLDLVTVYWGDDFTTDFNIAIRGMDIIDGNVHILINGALNGSGSNGLDNMASGVWEYDENIGLHHKYTLGTNKSTGTRANYGSALINRAGGLKNAYNGEIITGASIHIDNGSTLRHVIGNLSIGAHSRSYIITQKLQTPGEIQNWQRVWSKFRAKNSGDASIPNKLVVKYRTSESVDVNFEGGVTWTSTTTFTGTNGETGGEGNWGTASIGDEIEILGGNSAGIIAHITAISEAGGTYTITIDETLSAITITTSRVRVRNWVKLGSLTHSDISPLDFALYSKSSWIQFKIELRGYAGTGSVELEELQIVSEDHVASKS